MAAGSLWNLMLNGTPNMSVSPGFCKRVRFKKNKCQRCVEICPENAISLDPGPTIKNGCTDCGLCQGVCPMEVFQNGIYPDQYLVNRAASFLAKGRLPDKRKRLRIHCCRAENQNGDSLLLTCLGSITANFILGAALSGFDEVELTRGVCTQCHLRHGEKLLIHSITTSRVLFEGVGLEDFSIRMKEKEKRTEAMLNRREVFSIISSRLKTKAASFAHSGEKTIREKLTGNLKSRKEGKRLSPKGQFLRELLKQKGLENASAVKYNPEFPWGRIRIDQENCSACGICLALCPTGAISKESENEQQSLYFNSSACNNCSLCQEACPKNAIDFEEDFPLTDILKDEARVVARIKSTLCTICGETITAGKGKLCPTCQKRQVWPILFKI